MGIRLFATATLIAGLFVSTGFAADRHIRLGGNLAMGYNTVMAIEDKDVISTTVLQQEPFIKKEAEISYRGANGLGGFGFELGGSMLYPINDMFSVRANLLLGYHMHSASFTRDSTYTEYTGDASGNYGRMNSKATHSSLGDHSFNQFNLEVPVLCHMVLPTGDESGFYAEAGLVFDLNISTSTDEIIVKDEDINQFTMGVSVGVGRPLPFQKFPIDLDIHLVFGMLSMASDDYFSPTDVQIRVAGTYWFK